MMRRNLSNVDGELIRITDDILGGKVKVPGVVVRATEMPVCCDRLERGHLVGPCECTFGCMCECCECNTK